MLHLVVLVTYAEFIVILMVIYIIRSWKKIKWHGMDNNNVFQQDNDPKHNTRLIKQWLKVMRLVCLIGRYNHPDLNPIEHLWNKMDRCLRCLEAPVRTQDEVWDASSYK